MAELFRTLLNMSAESCWVILAVLALRLLLRRAPKSCSYALWSAVLFRLLCPVSFQSAANLFSLTGAKQEPVPAGFGSAPVFAAPAVPAGQPAASSVPAIQGQTPIAAGAAQTAAGGITLMQVLAAGWLLGAAVLAAYGALSLVRLGRRLRWRLPDADGVYRVRGLETAFVLGVIRPRIYLPAGLPAEQERYILAHERTHLRRGDPVWRLLAFGALCLHWFNPLVWAAFFLSSRDMEMSCDEAVVRRFGPQIKKGYAASLLSLATGRRIVPGAPLAFGEGDTAPRIKNVLNYKKPGFWAAALAVAVVAALCVFLAADPLEAAVSDNAGRYTFLDESGNAHTVAFTLPEGWAFTPVGELEFIPAAEGADSELGTITINGQQAGKVWVCVFGSVYEMDEETQSRAMDPADPSRHRMFYGSLMAAGSTDLDLTVDWERDYTVLSATETTEAAVTNAYVNTNAAVLGSTYGAGNGEEPSWKLANRSALYFDLDESTSIRFVLSPETIDEGGKELSALAQSIRFEETTGAAAAAALGRQNGTALSPLYTEDLYEGGSPFDAVPADLEERLQNAIAGGLVPDRRSGQRASALNDRPWLSGGAGVVLLGEYPQKNLYVYGYYDETVGQQGLIVDAGTKQSLTAFPFRYTSGGRLGEPALYLTEDGGTLYMICETGTGTGMAIDELRIFQLADGTVRGYAVDSGAVADAFADRLTAKLHPASDEVRFEGQWVTFASAEGTLLSGGVTAQGLPEGADAVPASYFCGQFLGYTVSGSTLYATCQPVMFNAAGEGFLYPDGEGEENLTLVMPVSSAADGAADLAYGPLDAWYDSVLAELDDAARTDGGCHILPAARRWQADLNHDGEPETIAFDLAALEARGLASLTVCDKEGSLLVEEQFSTSHVGWNTIGLYHDETGDYLLSYQPYYMQGTGAFSFSLFSVGADGSWQEKERMEVSFSAGMPYGAPDNDVDALMEFARRATDLWSRTTLLVTTDADLVINGLYDEAGRKADPGNANYYVADNDLSAPLHYVETMAWTSSALDDPAAVQEAGSEMRDRLEAVNRMLAAHRAEVEAQSAQSAVSGGETALSPDGEA